MTDRFERGGLVVEPHQRQIARTGAQPLPPAPVQLDLGEPWRALQPLALHVDLHVDGSGQRGSDQFVLGAEVMHQSVDAHPERCGHRSQRSLRQTMLGEVCHDLIEQLTFEMRISGAGHVDLPYLRESEDSLVSVELSVEEATDAQRSEGTGHLRIRDGCSEGSAQLGDDGVAR